jgi:GNAT superfamily N-acetyltransferase
VADETGSLLGYISGYCHPAFYSGGNTAWIDEILVSPAYRRQGIGRQLMSAFAAWAVRQDCVLVSLATAGSREFYESIGYTTKAGYYKKYFAHL